MVGGDNFIEVFVAGERLSLIDLLKQRGFVQPVEEGEESATADAPTAELAPG